MIISLADKKLELNKELIESLENLLQEAREGNIDTFVYAYADTKSGFFTGSTYDRPLIAMGLVAALQADVTRDAMEIEE